MRIDSETKCINDDAALLLVHTRFCGHRARTYLQHRRHFRASQHNRLSFRSFICRSNHCPSNQYICSLCFLRTHTHTVIYAECQVRAKYINIINTSIDSVHCVWLHIRCSIYWTMERAKRTNNPISFNVRMTHVSSILLFVFVIGALVLFILWRHFQFFSHSHTRTRNALAFFVFVLFDLDSLHHRLQKKHVEFWSCWIHCTYEF